MARDVRSNLALFCLLIEGIGHPEKAHRFKRKMTLTFSAGPDRCLLPTGTLPFGCLSELARDGRSSDKQLYLGGRHVSYNDTC